MSNDPRTAAVLLSDREGGRAFIVPSRGAVLLELQGAAGPLLAELPLSVLPVVTELLADLERWRRESGRQGVLGDGGAWPRR